MLLRSTISDFMLFLLYFLLVQEGELVFGNQEGKCQGTIILALLRCCNMIHVMLMYYCRCMIFEVKILVENFIQKKNVERILFV